MEFPILIFWTSSKPLLGCCFWCCFFIQIYSEQQRRTWSDATLVMRRLIWICTVCQRPTKWRQGINDLNITPPVLEITSRNFRKRKNLECNLLYGWNWDCANQDVCPFMENVKFYWKLLWTAPTYTYSYKDIRFETLSNVERMVVWRKPPRAHHCRPWQSCKWTMTYPYIWMCTLVCLIKSDIWKSAKISCPFP